MPSHHWDDKLFDWKALYEAEVQICRILSYVRVGVHSKEKWGTIRWSFYLFDGTLHSLTHPGYVYNQYPRWAYNLTMGWRLLLPLVSFIRPVQMWTIRWAFDHICTKYAHIQEEIIQDVPSEDFLPKRLRPLYNSMWTKYEITTKENP